MDIRHQKDTASFALITAPRETIPRSAKHAREVMRFIRQYPFLSYAAISILFYQALGVLESVGSGYDDGGIGGSAFLLSWLWNLFAFPFYLSSELLFSLNHGEAMPKHMLIALASGIAVCIMAEVAFHQWRRSNRSSTQTTKEKP